MFSSKIFQVTTFGPTIGALRQGFICAGKNCYWNTNCWACRFVGIVKSLKKENLTQVFSCEFCEISKNIFFAEHLWATAPQHCDCITVYRFDFVCIFTSSCTKLVLHVFFSPSRVTWKHWVPKWAIPLGVFIVVVVEINDQTVFRSISLSLRCQPDQPN